MNPFMFSCDYSCLKNILCVSVSFHDTLIVLFYTLSPLQMNTHEYGKVKI